MENNTPFTIIPLGSFVMSQVVDQFVPAFLKVQGSLSPIKKSMHAHKHKYADINVILEEVLPILEANNIALWEPPVSTIQKEDFLQIVLIHTSGQYIATTLSLYHDKSMQPYGSSITYARRYAIVSLLGLPQEDDDGAAATKSIKSKTSGDEPVLISRDHYDNLITLIKQSNDPAALAKQIMDDTKKKLDQMTERQYDWIIRKYFKNV